MTKPVLERTVNVQNWVNRIFRNWIVIFVTLITVSLDWIICPCSVHPNTSISGKEYTGPDSLNCHKFVAIYLIELESGQIIRSRLLIIHQKKYSFEQNLEMQFLLAYNKWRNQNIVFHKSIHCTCQVESILCIISKDYISLPSRIDCFKDNVIKRQWKQKQFVSKVYVSVLYQLFHVTVALNSYIMSIIHKIGTSPFESFSLS